ncbi:hypothetical protein P3S67_001127 [Capsicum chacoense]
MGRKGSWFGSIKKALSPDPKEKADKKASKSKKKWFGKEKNTLPEELTVVTTTVSPPHPLFIPTVEEVTLEELKEDQTKHAYSVIVATAATAEAAVAAAHAAAVVVQFTTARRVLRALREHVILKLLVYGPTTKRQTANALKCMQILSQVQSQIIYRIRMLEENRALQRQLILCRSMRKNSRV